MTTVMVMDLAFHRVGEVAQYQSFTIKRDFYGVGAFHLTILREMDGWDVIQIGMLLFPSDQPEKMVIVEKMVRTETSVIFSGVLLKGIVRRRICLPPLDNNADPYKGFGWDRFTGDAESAYHHFAEHNLLSTGDDKRDFPSLVQTQNQHRGISLPWQARFDKLADLFATIGQTTGLGWDIQPDFENKRFCFGAWEGVNRTQGIARAVIALEMGNASAVTYTKNAQTLISTVYAGGAGEDENRLILSVGNDAMGFARREQYADLGSVSDPDMLTLGASKKLVSVSDTLTATVLDRGLCRYGTDYQVGDKVTVVMDEFQLNARLITMEETIESGKLRLLATFGDAPVTLTALLTSPQTVR